MTAVVAYAEASDQSSSGVVIVILAAALILLVSGLSFLPVYAAWKRRHRSAQNIVAFSLLWGLLTAATLMNTTISQIRWSREHLQNMLSGYVDPNGPNDAPKPPWVFWGVLAVGYLGIIAWSLLGAPVMLGRMSSAKAPPDPEPRGSAPAPSDSHSSRF